MDKNTAKINKHTKRNGTVVQKIPENYLLYMCKLSISVKKKTTWWNTHSACYNVFRNRWEFNKSEEEKTNAIYLPFLCEYLLVQYEYVWLSLPCYLLCVSASNVSAIFVLITINLVQWRAFAWVFRHEYAAAITSFLFFFGFPVCAYYLLSLFSP